MDPASVPLFQGMLDGEIGKFTLVALQRTYQPGETIFRENDPGGDLLLIEKGLVEVRVRGEGGAIGLVSLGPSDVLGEISVIDEGPRSAEAEAKAPTRVHVWTREVLRRFFEKEPRIGYIISSNIGRIIATRIRGANALLLYRAGR